MKINKIFYILSLILTLQYSASQFLCAQEQTSSKVFTPEPYTDIEVPLWLSDAGRMVIISVGIFPFTSFFTQEALDTTRWIQNNYNPIYTPWPFKNQYPYVMTQAENEQVLYISIGSAIGCAVTDYAINLIIRAIQQKPLF